MVFPTYISITSSIFLIFDGISQHSLLYKKTNITHQFRILYFVSQDIFHHSVPGSDFEKHLLIFLCIFGFLCHAFFKLLFIYSVKFDFDFPIGNTNNHAFHLNSFFSCFHQQCCLIVL